MSAGRGTAVPQTFQFDFAWVTRSLGLLILLYSMFSHAEPTLTMVGALLVGLDKVVRP